MGALNVLLMDMNSISVIGAGTFNGLDNLNELDLSMNGIQEISANIFTTKRLKRLDLCQNDLIQIDPYAFAELRALVNLNLSKNSLTILNDQTFSGLTNLNILLLNENHILNIQPNTFAHLLAIQQIDLSSNALQTLSGNMFGTNQQLPLQKLSFQMNGIENVQPQTFDYVPHIGFLSLAHNRISRLDDNLFEPLNNLRKLHLQDNRITELPKKVYDDISRVTELQIKHNKLSFLPASECVFNNLETISFHGNPWQCACLREILDFITELSKRRHVDYKNEDNPFYLGARPLCYEAPIDPPAPCVRDIRLVRQHKVVELYENELGGRTNS